MSQGKYNYDELELEFIQGPLDQSIRGFSAAHGIAAWSTVNKQANDREWTRKRAEYHAQVSQKAIALIADRTAEKVARIKSDFLDVLQAAILKMGLDLRDRTIEEIDHKGEKVLRIIPGQTVTPDGISRLIDRMLVLTGQPTSIEETRNLGINLSNTGLPPDVLAALASLGSEPVEGSEGRARLPGSKGTGPN